MACGVNAHIEHDVVKSKATDQRCEQCYCHPAPAVEFECRNCWMELCAACAKARGDFHDRCEEDDEEDEW